MEISSPSAASTTCALVMTTPPRVSARKPVPCASPAWILNTLRLKRAKSVAAGSTRASERLGPAALSVAPPPGLLFVGGHPAPAPAPPGPGNHQRYVPPLNHRGGHALEGVNPRGAN